MSEQYPLTSLYDIDICILLQYLSALDIHHILMLNKNIQTTNHEYKQLLYRMKRSTFRKICYCNTCDFYDVNYILNIDLNENTKYKNIPEILKMDSVQLLQVESINLKTDTLGNKYIYIIHNDKHKHIIYDRYVKVIENTMILYCK